jgi:3-deoxy-7-phosphoheptulonate synthase
MEKTSDLHVVENRPLLYPATLHYEYPITEKAASLVCHTRRKIRHILHGEDKRVLVIVGPCSIHDVEAAIEYGERLRELRERLQERLEIVMRVYFEKPRTTTGWKGLINDPYIDDSYMINTGLRWARKLLLDLAQMGLPAATELLDPIIPQYIADLISWTAIGARTTESQTHREMASGLSMPVGFKNGTDGSLDSAMNAMLAASGSHHFLGINYEGLASIVTTTGNPDGHVVLRGGQSGTNYDLESVEMAANLLTKKSMNSRLMIDCSHGNSSKDYQRQPIVLSAIADQIAAGSPHLMGVMVESHLVAGNQSIPKDITQLVKGKSITDACVDFTTTTTMLENLADAVDRGRFGSQKTSSAGRGARNRE